MIGRFSLGLSLYGEWARKEFSYTPLALFFRRARGSTTESIRPINYVTHDGTSVVIAPRFEFTIQLVSGFSVLLDRQRLFDQQNLKGKYKTFPVSKPFNTRNHIGLTQATHQQGERLLLNSSRLVWHYLAWIESNAVNLNPMKGQNQTELGNRFWRFFIGSTGNFALNTPLVQRYLALVTHRKDKMSDRLVSRVLNSKNVEEIRSLHRPIHYVGAPKSILRQEQDEIVKFPAVSVSHYKGQQQLGKIEHKEKLQGRNRIFEVKPAWYKSSFAFDNQLLTRAVCRITQYLTTLFNQRNTEKLNRVYSKDNPYFIGSLTSNKSESNYSKLLGNAKRRRPTAFDRQLVQQRQLGSVDERQISPAQVRYRTENKTQLLSAGTIVEPKQLPIIPPKIDIDRLSRDVWNNIEKRIRIERERHGRL